MYHCDTFQIGEVKIPLCMVDLAQTIEEWKDIQSVKVDDQVSTFLNQESINELLINNVVLDNFRTCAFSFPSLKSKQKVRETIVYITSR